MSVQFAIRYTTSRAENGWRQNEELEKDERNEKQTSIGRLRRSEEEREMSAQTECF